MVRTIVRHSGRKEMLGSRILMVVAAVMLAIGAFAQTSQSPIPMPLPAQPNAVTSDAPLGPRDVVEIHVFQDSSLNLRATVGDDGAITMPPVGRIVVGGL